MDRRAFLADVTSALVAAPLVAEAQQAGKMYRIGVLEQGASGRGGPVHEAFRQQLRELGYVEG